MKVAIIHDVLYEYGGSERVAEKLLEIYPKADFYTFYFNKSNKLIFDAFSKRKPKSSFIQIFPLVYKLGRYFSILKFVSVLYFYFLDLSKYDLVITSCHSFNSKAVRKSKGTLHICYLHTPPRFLYDQYNELSFIKKFPFNLIFYLPLRVLKFFDGLFAKNPDYILVNSESVRKRVKKYYKREATVIYPPVYVPKSQNLKRPTGNYYLSVGRIVSQKGIELSVRTAKKFGFELKVVGEGYLADKLKRDITSNIKFLGNVDDDRLREAYVGAKALIWAAREEDFGIVPVEAMAYGKPVIAYGDDSGTKETVIDGKTGVFFEEYTPDGLYKAIKRLEGVKVRPADCVNQANKFNDVRFKKEFREFVVSHS